MTLLFDSQIIGCSNIEESAKDKVEDLLVRHGLADVVPLTEINKDKAVQDLLVAEVIINRIAALDSFVKGLNCMGLGDLLRRHPSISSYVLPSLNEAAIDSDILKVMLSKAKDSIKDCSLEQDQSWSWFQQFFDEAANLKGSIKMNKSIVKHYCDIVSCYCTLQ